MGSRRPHDLLSSVIPPIAVLLAAAVVVALSGAGVPVTRAMATSLALALLVTASAAALVALRRGLRHGRLVDLAFAGTSASLAGAGLASLGGAASLAPAILAASAFGLAAAVGARDESVAAGGRWRIPAAVTVAVVAEIAVVVGLVPGLADAVRATEPALHGAAVGAAVIGLAIASGRSSAAAIGMVGIGPLALALGDGPSSEVLALGALTGAQLLALGRAAPRTAPGPSAGADLSPILDHIPDAVLRFDGRLRLQAWNAAAADLLGLDAGSAGARLEDLLGVPVGELPSSSTAGSRLDGIGGLAIGLHRDGDGVLAVVTQPPIVDDSADRLGRELRATIEELLQARRTVELQRTELERASTVDALTGVASRAAILERLELEVAEARRYRHPVAIVLLDVDGFAEVNRRVGIDEGDAILREIALRIRLRVRQADALGRSGSDGFLAILPHTDEAGAATFADALRLRAGQRPVTIGEDRLRVTLSAGVAVMRAGEELDVDGLLRRADEALESARHAGGDRIALDRLHGLARLEGGAPVAASAAEETAQDSGA
jgi:diguanylate cyclase (GGDEF)-like protein